MAQAGDWPHTTRVLPWMVAAFLAMFWLVPFDSIDLSVTLPFDAKLDRLLMAVTGTVWLAIALAGNTGAPRLRSSPINAALAFFFALALASIMFNLQQLEWLQESTLGLKSLALFVSFVAFFVIVSSVVRVSEIRAFVTLFIALGCVAAVGTIWEYRSDFNAFYTWSDALLPSFFQVTPEGPNPRFERASVEGPSGHGLAIATMLAMALPFAIAYWLQEQDKRRRVYYFIATALLLAGGFATVRKTSAVVPAAALITLVALRPRQMVKLAPAGLLVLVMIQGVAPGAMGSIRSQLSGLISSNDSISTQGRKSDYAAVVPDMRAHPILGRGFGTYDHTKYRILDNQYMGLRISTGILGVCAYMAFILCVLVAAIPTIRSGDPVRGPPALAGAAAAAAFGVANALYDSLAFPQAPYLFFFIAALVVVVTTREPALAPSPAPGTRVPEGSITTLKPHPAPLAGPHRNWS